MWSCIIHKGSAHKTNANHFGIEHTCDKCSFKAKTKEDVKYHTKTKHDGLKIDCDYQATTPDYLRIQKNTKHTNLQK